MQTDSKSQANQRSQKSNFEVEPVYTGVAIEVGSLAAGGYSNAYLRYGAISSSIRVRESIIMRSRYILVIISTYLTLVFLPNNLCYTAAISDCMAQLSY